MQPNVVSKLSISFLVSILYFFHFIYLLPHVEADLSLALANDALHPPGVQQ